MERITVKRRIPKGTYATIKEDLVRRFMEGERLTVDTIIEDYFGEITTRLEYLDAYAQAKNILITVKLALRSRYNVWMGNVENGGVYAICQSEEDARHAINLYNKLAKGLAFRSQLLVSNAVGKNYISPSQASQELVYLPKYIGR